MDSPKRLYSILGYLLGVLTLAHYGLFTLLSDNHSYIVSWPWIFIAQSGFAYGVFWSIWEIWGRKSQEGSGLRWLGAGLDWVVLLSIVTFGLSIVLAPYPEIAFSYTLVNLAYIALLYGLYSALTHSETGIKSRQQLLVGLGGIAVVFTLLSLGLWIARTVLPELRRLQQLQENGVEASFDFSNLFLRNWATFGHPNYVAGYLILALPLLATLFFQYKGWLRWLWGLGFALGLLTFYTTNSRGGWLGLLVAVSVIAAFLVWRSSFPRRWISFGTLAGFTALVLWALQNDRLRGTFTGLFTLGQTGGEFAYRWITVYTGWHMGLSQPLTGLGLGSVPTFYQRYRPHWAGQEAEILFQLHSTPMQIWAELGIFGILTSLLGIGLIIRLVLRLGQSQLSREDRVLVGALGAGLSGYLTLALTDYQLDVIAITGLLIVYLALLASLHTIYLEPEQYLKRSWQPVALGMVGVSMLGSLLWLTPVNLAWLSSSQGFATLQQQEPDIEYFANKLIQAHRYTPWDPYYSYQLGWYLGEAALVNQDSQVQSDLAELAQFWFQQAQRYSPSWEFGHSHLGWLFLNENPQQAVAEFSQAAQLVPARRMVMFGLGQGWLGLQNEEKGIEAIALEFFRYPITFTSPLWQEEGWQSLYPRILQQTESIYDDLIQETEGASQQWLHQSRGMLRWWQGNEDGAREDFITASSPVSQLLLSLDRVSVQNWQSQLNAEEQVILETGISNTEPWACAIAAWLYPQERAEWLQRGWLAGGQNLTDSEVIPALTESMNQAQSFTQWLQQNAPSRPYRIQRTGFGVISRHTDGFTPEDYAVLLENLPMTYYFGNLLSDLYYQPELDQKLNSYFKSVISP